MHLRALVLVAASSAVAAEASAEESIHLGFTSCDGSLQTFELGPVDFFGSLISVDAEADIGTAANELGVYFRPTFGWHVGDVQIEVDGITYGNEALDNGYVSNTAVVQVDGTSSSYALDMSVRLFQADFFGGETASEWVDLTATIANSCLPPAAATRADFKPGSNPSAVNLGSRGTTPVAVYGTATLDLSGGVELADLSINGVAAELSLKGNGSPRLDVDDLDGDGFLDVTLHLETESVSGLVDGDATLDGVAVGGQRFTAFQDGAVDPVKIAN